MPHKQLNVWLAALLLLCATAQGTVQSAALQTRDIVFVVKTGTNRDGTPAFRVANDQDRGAARIFDVARRSAALERTAAYYRYIQEAKARDLMSSASGYGMSPQDQQLARSLLATEPIYIELKQGGGGPFNDWRARFTVRETSGRTIQVQSPRVVLPMLASEVTGGDAALLEQTLVHEAGHSMMAKAYGLRDLPDSPYLQHAHSGGSHTDLPFAVIEGWAEFIGAYFTNRLTIAKDPPNSISDNLYSYNSDGSPKTADQLQKTEGWVATVLWMLASRSGIENALGKMTAVMVRYKPQTIVAFFQAFERSYPADSRRMREVVSRASHGRIYSGSIGGGTGGTEISSLYGTYEATLERYFRLRYSYLAAQGIHPYERQRLFYAMDAEGRNVREISARLERDIRSGRQAGGTMLALQRLSGQYERRYEQVRGSLSGRGWYDRRQSGPLEAEAQALGEILDHQHRLIGSLESAPVYRHYSGTPSRGNGRPGAPEDSRQAYRDLVDKLKHGSPEEAASALEAYRKSQSTADPAGQ